MADYDFVKIRQVLATEPGKELRRYLVDKMSSLALIESVPLLSDPVEQAVALQSQRRAYETLKEIVIHIADIRQPATLKGKESFASGLD